MQNEVDKMEILTADSQLIDFEVNKSIHLEVLSADKKIEESEFHNEFVGNDFLAHVETTSVSIEKELNLDANFENQPNGHAESPKPGVNSNQEYMPANQIEKKGVRPSLINRDESTYLADLPAFGGRYSAHSATSGINLKDSDLVFDQEKCLEAGVSVSDYLRNAISRIVIGRSTAPRPSSIFTEDTSSESSEGSCSDSEEVVEDVAEKILEGGNVKKNKRKRENFLESRQKKREKQDNETSEFRPNSSNLETYCNQKEFASDRDDCVMMVDGSLVLPHRNLKDDLLELLHEK